MSAAVSMPEPVGLIENVDGDKLVVNKEALKILLEISQPVVVIAAVGKYRTGKSYLMNKLAGRRSGFALSSGIQPKTKGIWMWCVPHPQNSNQTLILLDTEGLGDVGKGDCKNDAWIFCLAVLLSSALVYNSIGTIDQQSMEQLHYVTELTTLIKLKSSSEQKVKATEYKRLFPSFTWCVRDFCLILEKDGKAITEDEYLMSSLRLKEGADKKTQDYNLPRECLLHYFHSHKCFVFDRPASGRNLPNLEQLEESQLEKEFVEQTTKFCQYMIRKSRVKTVDGGIEVTGRMLAVLTDSYVRAIQSGSVPCLENAVLALAKRENIKALEDALSEYLRNMDKYVHKMFPTETQQEFLNIHMGCEKEAIEIFIERSVNDKDQKYQHKLKELIDHKMKEYSTKNENASIDFCRKLLRELSLNLESDIKAGEYSRPGGHKLYLVEMEKILEGYNRTPEKGIKALEVLQDYISEQKDTEAAIIQADVSVTQKERELAEQRSQVENAERERQILEEKNKHLQQRLEDQRRSYEQHKEMFIRKLQKEKEIMTRQYNLVKEMIEEEKKTMTQQSDTRMLHKLEEQEKMINEELEERVRVLDRQIRHTHEVMEDFISEQIGKNNANNHKEENLPETQRRRPETENLATSLENEPEMSQKDPAEIQKTIPKMTDSGAAITEEKGLYGAEKRPPAETKNPMTSPQNDPATSQEDPAEIQKTIPKKKESGAAEAQEKGLDENEQHPTAPQPIDGEKVTEVEKTAEQDKQRLERKIRDLEQSLEEQKKTCEKLKGKFIRKLEEEKKMKIQKCHQEIEKIEKEKQEAIQKNDRETYWKLEDEEKKMNDWYEERVRALEGEIEDIRNMKIRNEESESHEKVTEVEKNAERERQRLERERQRLEREKQRLERENRDLHRCIEEQKKSFEQLKEMFIKKLEQDRMAWIQQCHQQKERLEKEKQKATQKKDRKMIERLKKEEERIYLWYEERVTALEGEIAHIRNKTIRNKESDGFTV
ncbi:guanylate-binding protein 7-like [Leptodactylus fuscus]|uniref:guanylate-binding protein 7-like n=1 Tax=Leptodactylus fuscus TaxID=238119 RepID=UPI003F4ED557